MSEGKDKVKRGYDASRTVQYYALLIVAVGLVNVLFYWERGTVSSLVLAGVSGIALVGWLLFARRLLRAERADKDG